MDNSSNYVMYFGAEGESAEDTVYTVEFYDEVLETLIAAVAADTQIESFQQAIAMLEDMI